MKTAPPYSCPFLNHEPLNPFKEKRLTYNLRPLPIKHPDDLLQVELLESGEVINETRKKLKDSERKDYVHDLLAGVNGTSTAKDFIDKMEGVTDIDFKPIILRTFSEKLSSGDFDDALGIKLAFGDIDYQPSIDDLEESIAEAFLNKLKSPSNPNTIRRNCIRVFGSIDHLLPKVAEAVTHLSAEGEYKKARTVERAFSRALVETLKSSPDEHEAALRSEFGKRLKAYDIKGAVEWQEDLCREVNLLAQIHEALDYFDQNQEPDKAQGIKEAFIRELTAENFESSGFQTTHFRNGNPSYVSASLFDHPDGHTGGMDQKGDLHLFESIDPDFESFDDFNLLVDDGLGRTEIVLYGKNEAGEKIKKTYELFIEEGREVMNGFPGEAAIIEKMVYLPDFSGIVGLRIGARLHRCLFKDPKTGKTLEMFMEIDQVEEGGKIKRVFKNSSALVGSALKEAEFTGFDEERRLVFEDDSARFVIDGDSSGYNLKGVEYKEEKRVIDGLEEVDVSDFIKKIGLNVALRIINGADVVATREMISDQLFSDLKKLEEIAGITILFPDIFAEDRGKFFKKYGRHLAFDITFKNPVEWTHVNGDDVKNKQVNPGQRIPVGTNIQRIEISESNGLKYINFVGEGLDSSEIISYYPGDFPSLEGGALSH